MSREAARYIRRKEGLDEVADAIERAEYVALDTESNSLHVYRERVCFIQIEAGGAIYLIDALEIDDLGPLLPLLSDPDILTILHGADYDVSCLDRDYGVTFGGLFDTMIAAKILGYEHLGLAALASRHLDVELDKSLTRHDWGQRPVEPRYHKYLVDDVIYLRELEEILGDALEDEDLFEEAEIEFRRVSRLRWSRPDHGEDAFRRIKGSRALDQRGLAILKELHALRERLAERADRPPFKVLGNHQLLEVARRAPRSPAALRRLQGFHPRQLDRHGRALLEAVERGLENQHSVPLRPPRRGTPPDEREVAISEGLRAWRRDRAAGIDRPTLVVLPNPTLEEIARLRPRTLEDLAQIEDLGKRRLGLYGEEILAIVNNPPQPSRQRRRRREQG